MVWQLSRRRERSVGERRRLGGPRCPVDGPELWPGPHTPRRGQRGHGRRGKGERRELPPLDLSQWGIPALEEEWEESHEDHTPFLPLRQSRR